MPSDGRYGYSHPNPPNYDYNPYPPPVSAYEPPQVVQAPSLRSSRSTNPPSQPHSPPLSNYHYQAPSYQQQGYGPGQYQHPPPQPPPQAQHPPPPPHPSSHWPNEGWGHYNQQQYPPHPPPTHASAEPPYTSGPGRPEQVSSSSSEPRGYAPSHPPPPPSSGDSRRGEDRHHAPPPPPPPHSSSASSIPPPPSSAHHHQQQQPQQPPPPPHHHHQAQQHNNQGKPSRREKESPPAIPPPGTPSNLDFMKLLESYRIILDGTEALSAPSSSSSSASRTPPAAETIERMLQSATYGWHTLDEALAQHSHRQSGGNAAAPTESTRSPKEKDPEEATPKEPANGATASSSSSSKRQKVDDTVQEGQTCLGCNATSTPEWRRGPMGPRTLCNACGLVYAKLIKKRFRETLNMKGQNGKNIPPQAAGDDSLEGESEDDDGYSQDRRSELVEGRD